MTLSDLKDRIFGGSAKPVLVAGSDGQDRRIARKARWPRYLAIAVVLGAAAGGGTWLMTRSGGNVYRAPASQFTLGTVREGAFEDYIAVRPVVAPLIISYLTTEQGGT